MYNKKVGRYKRLQKQKSAGMFPRRMNWVDRLGNGLIQDYRTGLTFAFAFDFNVRPARAASDHFCTS